MACCQSQYSVPKEVAKKIMKDGIIDFSQLRRIDNFGSWHIKRCSRCGYFLGDDFDYCPKCGKKI